MVRYELLATCPHTGARRGRLHTPHGTVETPFFMPVGTYGAVKTVGVEDLEALGFEGILSNTYHLSQRPGEELVRRRGGLHRFMGWRGSILTDSGGYQVMSLSKHRTISDEGVRFKSHLDGSELFLTPERSIEIQAALGVDISMMLDECPPYPCTRDEAASAMRRTHLWAPRNLAARSGAPSRRLEDGRSSAEWLASVDERGLGEGSLSATHSSPPPPPPHRPVEALKASERGPEATRWGDGDQSVFGIVQGGVHLDLRTESAKFMSGLPFAGLAIGGVSVGEPTEMQRPVVAHTAPLLPKDKARYLMGVGHPDDILHAVACGVDMFDCVLPTRMARHHALYTLNGRVNAAAARWAEYDGPFDEGSVFPATERYSAAYVRHLFKVAEPLGARLATLHNLAFYARLMREIREAIVEGTWPTLMARYANA